MNETQAFPFKCPTCGMNGLYKAKLSGIAADYRCPHDGSKMIVQSPVTPMVEIIELPAAVAEMKEFTYQLSDAVIKKLGVPGL